MAKQVTKRITRFDGGISESTRLDTTNGCALVAHFDVRSDPKKLTPYRTMTPDEDTTFKIVKFQSNLSGVLYGYGVVVGSGKVKIYQKSDAITGSWTAATTGEDAGGSRNTDCFILYGSTLYGFTAGSRVWSYNTSTNTFTGTARSLSYTTVAQGLVGKKDGILYLPYDRYIATYNGTTWNDTAFTLPLGVTITDIEEYGNYIVIGTNTTGGYGNKSAMYVWDRAKSATPDEIVDFGVELLKSVVNINGSIIGLMNTPAGYSISPKIVFKQWNGGDKATVIKEYISQSTTALVSLKQQIGETVYFAGSIKLNGTAYVGVFSFGRKGSLYPYSLSLAYLPDNDTAVTSIEGIYFYGEFLFVAHNNDGSVNRTLNTASYGATSVYETEIFGGETALPKDLLEVRANYAPLPASGQVVLKYRKNYDTSWTTLFTETDDNAFMTQHDARIGQWNELQFRLESTGGAEITGLQFTYEYGD